MKIIWMGHGSFRIETGGEVLLIDPWIDGNPMMEGKDAEAAIGSATQILVTHGHFDHTSDIVNVSERTGAPVHAIFELGHALQAMGAKEGHAFNMGGSITFGEVKVTMVPASHSSSMKVDGAAAYMGQEAGFVIQSGGQVLYFSGDTCPMADMAWIADYFKPTIGILSAGGYYTMDMEMAAYAAKTYFDFKTVIPCHYRTFDALEQSADRLAAGLPGVTVIEPQVLEAIEV
ncbi:metal-dependent hydrolase [Sagittula sp.]|uniref:metal-dependent hydrolase n=1 Tax=Sagittula sp. TaxID=2038081 RepID=UPI003513A5ED